MLTAAGALIFLLILAIMSLLRTIQIQQHELKRLLTGYEEAVARRADAEKALSVISGAVRYHWSRYLHGIAFLRCYLRTIDCKTHPALYQEVKYLASDSLRCFKHCVRSIPPRCLNNPMSGPHPARQFAYHLRLPMKLAKLDGWEG